MEKNTLTILVPAKSAMAWSDDTAAQEVSEVYALTMDLRVTDNPQVRKVGYYVTVKVADCTVSANALVAYSNIQASLKLVDDSTPSFLKLGIEKVSKSICRQLFGLMDQAYVRPDQLESLMKQFAQKGQTLYVDNINPQEHTTDYVQLNNDSLSLPGMNYMVYCPSPKCILSEHSQEPVLNNLRSIIMHLNDKHKWTRDSIADWLDVLHGEGKVDLSFS